MVATKWGNLIRGINVKTIRLENDFFDLGGHSILAQQMLLDVRRQTGVNVPINALYEHPSLVSFSAES
jgi:L-2-aminoadipate reductase